MGNVTVTLTGDEARILRSLDKVIAKERALAQAGEQAGKKTVAAQRKVLNSQDKMERGAQKTGDSFITSAAKMSAAFAAPAKAIQIVMQALTDLDAKREAIASKQRDSERGLGSLAQLAAGNPMKLRRLVEAAKQTYMEGGAENMDAAARQIFSLESAGALKERAFFSRLFGVVDDPATMARSAATLQTAMGEKETGSMRDIVSKAMAASKYSPASAEALLQAASRAGGPGRMLGMSDEEILSSTAIMATATGSAEEGATTVNSLLTAMVKQGGFQGMKLTDAIKKVEGMGLSDPELVKWFGRKEALRSYSVLKENLQKINEISAAQSFAQETDLSGRMLASRDLIPEIVASREQRMAKAREEIALTQAGIDRNRSERLIQQQMADHYAAGGSGFIGAVSENTLRSGRWLMGDRAIKGFAQDEAAEQERIRAETQRLTAVANNLEYGAKSLKESARDNEGGTTLAKPDEDR